jgi:hypothetical protein
LQVNATLTTEIRQLWLGCFAMLNKNAQGLRLIDKAHSSDTRQTVSRLGRARDTVSRDIGAGRASIEAFAVGRIRNRGNAVARSIAPIAPADSEALARAIAEIEIASAALRQSEPTLEPWRPNAEIHGEQRYLPVWILIGVVWIAALLGLSGATGAILYLAG